MKTPRPAFTASSLLRTASPFLAIAGALLLAACAGGLPKANPDLTAFADANGYPHATAASLNDGRALLMQNCAGCHSLPVPADYVAPKWETIMDRMSVKANLSGSQDSLVRAYVISASGWSRARGK